MNIPFFSLKEAQRQDHKSSLSRVQIRKELKRISELIDITDGYIFLENYLKQLKAIQ